MLERAGAMAAMGPEAVYPTLKAAMNAFLNLQPGSPVGVPEVEDAPADSCGDEARQE
jgi:hypothetical protein